MSTQRRVLVTDGEERSALAVVRSLGRAGHAVFVCSTRRRCLAGASRFAAGQAKITNPLHNPAKYLGDVRNLVQQWQIDVLIPVSEASLLAILPARDVFVSTVIPFAEAQSFCAISNKTLVLGAARDIGIATPGQFILSAAADIDGLRQDQLQFPVVLKPERSVVGDSGRRSKSGVRHVADWEELSRSLHDLPQDSFPVLLQERIDGPGVGVFLLMWNGEVLAHFVHRRIREKPPAGGVSVYCESISANAELLDRSIALLRSFNWQGVAMVEYKLSARSGMPYLMEINGRFWGSLQLAIDAGVDFPCLLLKAATGLPQVNHDYHVGVRSRWLWGDVDHLLTRLRYSRQELALSPDAPTRPRLLLEFARAFSFRTRSDVFRIRDLRPGVRETLDWIRRR